MGMGSGIQGPRRDPGVKKALDPGSRSATLGCTLHNNFVVRNFVKLVYYTILHCSRCSKKYGSMYTKILKI
jgi:hypothetical protein